MFSCGENISRLINDKEDFAVYNILSSKIVKDKSIIVILSMNNHRILITKHGAEIYTNDSVDFNEYKSALRLINNRIINSNRTKLLGVWYVGYYEFSDAFIFINQYRELELAQRYEKIRLIDTIREFKNQQYNKFIDKIRENLKNRALFKKEII